MEIDVEILGSIIEFSIGLAGFAGIVAVFLRRASLFEAVERFRLINLIATAIGPAFLCFLAIILDRLYGGADTAVRICCATLMLYLAVLSFRALFARKTFSVYEEAQINPWFFVLMSIMGIGTIAVQFAATLGFFGSHTFTVFYIGLVVLLIMAVCQFVLAIVTGLGGSER